MLIENAKLHTLSFHPAHGPSCPCVAYYAHAKSLSQSWKKAPHWHLKTRDRTGISRGSRDRPGPAEKASLGPVASSNARTPEQSQQTSTAPPPIGLDAALLRA